MDDLEYERLQKAHHIKEDMRLIRDAIAILRKSHMTPNGAFREEETIVKSAVFQFINDDDIIEILQRKLESLKVEFSRL